MIEIILDKINNPADLKDLSMKELVLLAGEVRGFLIESVAGTGGHLASNLGVVELTIALHYVFDTPEDKIVWDVGHQCYVHKLLTGRRGRFGSLRMLDGLSGFPKTRESEYDAFDTGHSSTALSAALGIAAARDIAGDKFNVIAVAGDGSMTGGVAYEALNHAGQRQDRNIICILNDNGMSISASVGALSGYLSGLRTKSSYLRVKKELRGFLEKIPRAGKHIDTFLLKSKVALKRMLVGGGIFHNLGFNYIGPLDGHDLHMLIRVLSRVRRMEGPILVHVHTVKGKGYKNAERAPYAYHGVGAFDVHTGQANSSGGNTYSDIFGQILCEMAEKNDKLTAITAAMPDGTGLWDFSKLYPNRSFDVGIAEGHAVTFAAGLAKQGLIPVFAVYSTFLQRGYDQILHDVCLQNLHVILAIDRAGIVGQDGETHQGLFDLSYLLHMPNMRVLCPKDGKELAGMLELAVNAPGPWAIRYPRGCPPGFNGITSETDIGKAELLLQGNGTVKPDIAVISLGAMAEHALNACKMLEREGIHPALYNARSAKPIDPEMLQALTGYKYIVTAEDNVRSGGFGENLLSRLVELTGGNPPAIRIIAFPDSFIPQGERGEIFSIYGMDGKGIFIKIKDFVKP
ncbi:MAG: 1-deoxy-D-xylulose-5-phosphate synthase [Defluviitaleaceae bacterium]|nr:1-deoxy-D-xylulose-5-phosphate synthase [Defluviitaleaceae bacterium]